MSPSQSSDWSAPPRISSIELENGSTRRDAPHGNTRVGQVVQKQDLRHPMGALLPALAADPRVRRVHGQLEKTMVTRNQALFQLQTPIIALGSRHTLPSSGQFGLSSWTWSWAMQFSGSSCPYATSRHPANPGMFDCLRMRSERRVSFMHAHQLVLVYGMP